MTYTTLIDPREAATHLNDPGWRLIDCRSVLGRPHAGHEAYLVRHIAGAVFADLETDLSGPIVPGQTGRHPLPTPEAFNAAMSRLGVGPATQVVAYDEATGAMAAARLWWLLRWAGHDAVAVLNGGLRAWEAAGLPVASGEESAPPARFAGRYRPEMIASLDEVRSAGAAASLFDARAADRFRGENETVDPVAGHIPGARSLPFAGNVTEGGCFLSVDELRERLTAGGLTDAESAVCYCGSGVTAAHNLLAAAHAGFALPRLYPGSWSEWITDPARPVARGSA